MNISEKIYSRLLSLYPRAFRAEYSKAMLVHFRDQLHDAQKNPRPLNRAHFWFHIGFDTLSAALRERFLQASTKNQNTPMKTTPSFGFLFLSFFLVAMTSIVVIRMRQPYEYLAIARIEVTRAEGERTSAPDPYFIQTQFEKIKSQAVVDEVVEQLGLAKFFSQEYGISGEFRKETAAQMLRERLQVRQTRNTSLIEVLVFLTDSGRAAAVANELVRSYQRQSAGLVRVDILDQAVSGRRPVRPNVPATFVVGSILSAILSAIAAGLLKLFFRKSSPTLATP